MINELDSFLFYNLIDLIQIYPNIIVRSFEIIWTVCDL